MTAFRVLMRVQDEGGYSKKVSGRYRYKIILKCRNNARFREMMHLLLCESGSDPQSKEVTTFADLNPENVL